jgi:hypothetical protein
MLNRPAEYGINSGSVMITKAAIFEFVSHILRRSSPQQQQTSPPPPKKKRKREMRALSQCITALT